MIPFLWNRYLSTDAWSVKRGDIYDSNQDLFNLSGCSWFGFETQDFVINGLWSHSMEFYLDRLQEVGINAIRVPISSEWIFYNFDLYPDRGFVSADPSLQNLKSIEILDTLFQLTEKRHILIMLDLHRLHKEYISELWYSLTDQMFTPNTFFTTWYKLLDRYQHYPNLFAIDLLNEPHGSATWGSSSPTTDWNLFAQYAIQKLSERYLHHDWLFLVEGIGWGKDLSRVGDYPLQLKNATLMDRIVYSPHTYGKSVVNSIDPNNKDLLWNDWNSSFGYLTDYELTYIIGEYGGRTDIDSQWMNYLVDYLIEQHQRNAFFWSLGPNSGDVQGLLLDDWTTLDTFKTQLIRRLQPYPSTFIS